VCVCVSQRHKLSHDSEIIATRVCVTEADDAHKPRVLHDLEISATRVRQFERTLRDAHPVLVYDGYSQ